MERKEIPASKLKDLYWKEGLSVRKTAEAMGVSVGAVYERMREYGIPRRSQKEATAKANRGRDRAREVEISANKDWGYFFGLVLGDGSFCRNEKEDQYLISVKSTRKELRRVFSKVCEKILPNFSVSTWEWKDLYGATLGSKKLYEELDSLKEENSWRPPNFVDENDESLLGFLQGVWDAEGNVDPSNPELSISSGSKRSLKILKEKMEDVGIEVCDYCDDYFPRLRITKRDAISRFAEKVNFRIKRKAEKLQRIIELPRRESWSKEKALRRLKELGNELGRPPTERDDKTLASAIRRHVGKFSKAKKIVGFGEQYDTS